MRELTAYFRPATIDEAIALKLEHGDRAAYLAGGSDLLVHRSDRLQAMIDIRHVGLNFIRQEAEGYSIGGAALLCHAETALEGVAGGMLRDALRNTAPWLIRNAATVAGNVANASPAADAVPALLALDAELILQGEGEDRLPLRDVLTGPHQTCLGDRLITEIRVPAGAGGLKGAFIKLARSKSDIAQVNVAVAFSLEHGVFRQVRIALGAVAPTVIRASQTEALLEGSQAGLEVLREAEARVRKEVSPIDDWRASAEYRRTMAGVLMRRAITSAGTGSESGDGKWT